MPLLCTFDFETPFIWQSKKIRSWYFQCIEGQSLLILRITNFPCKSKKSIVTSQWTDYWKDFHYYHYGGFQLLDLIILELKSHMTCKKSKVSHWWKFYLSKKKPLQDLLSSLNAVISTNERHWIITGHVTFKLRYNQI